ncbi:Sterol regulatory element-binding protein cleavage-activating protein [Tolypocladium paradoxum]|uniref:Sterol regulatory element-binding protein cleavage-activating protein n=1 Tax=Tolypocladium paradoxum TaxID=94208 RepID=A0A2S4KUX2_9HYPO|nr:Sterol regulatory element-binding protein cleavage-activating protein [Tolypocladium paradoxum]
MIWYLLYPLRGTTEAPVLPPSHPLHSLFARYGRYAARHVVTTLLISAAVATILLYPIPFLFTSDFINGASNLPRHVWTVAQPVAYDAAVGPDIIMRSMWVHASYMEALNTDLLTSALELQDELLGITKDFSPARARGAAADLPLQGDSLSLAQRDAIHVANGLTNQSWFFHSPLLYWSCSRQRILADEDILSTVNDKKNQSTSVNVTLRHSIVFSGKRFEDRRLLAADTLVVTLLHLRDSPVGREWEKRALALPHKVGDKWDIYPPDGRAASSQLYEFQFRPISVQDIASLAVAYGLTLLYFLMSLSKLRAVKSKFGLMVTIATQIIFSTLSSFTVCAIFNIDLSRIPRVSYPLVILSMSLEHIFRLINAVLLTPFEDSVSSRIGQAFGATAVTALASSLQNVMLLAGLSRLVSHGVSEFCVFAAVAIVFDFFYMSTFFLSVLSVDVRRMELGDALAKASMRHNRRRADTGGRRSWWDRALQGKVAMSTRIAGTIVMFGFVLIAQWHFFGDEGLFRGLLRLCRGADPIVPPGLSDVSLLDDIHQARSPMSWLRMQDHETAQEVIKIIKPSAYCYTARVYDPLVFVRKDSDRVPHSKEHTLLPAAYDFVNHELARFVVIVIVVIAALRLLTNFLLWEDEPSTIDEHDSDDVPLLSVKSLARGHRMDIVLMTSSADGHVVSLDLDRTIRVWSIRGMGTSYVVAKGDDAAASLCPVIAMTIDDKSRWLALLSRPTKAAQPTVSFWSLKDKVWGPSVPADRCSQRPAALFFDPSAPSDEPRVLVVHQDGALTEVSAATSTESAAMALFPPQLTCARLVARKAEASAPTAQPVILAVSKQGAVHMACRKEATWQSRRLAIEGLGQSGANNVESLSRLNLFLVAATDCVHLVRAEDGVVLRTLQTGKMLPRPLKCAYACHRLSQPGSTGLTFFTLGYVEADSRDCILRTFVPSDDCDAIYLQTPTETRSSDWCTWDSAKETSKRIADPGAWEVVSDGSAVGIRHKQWPGKDSRGSPSSGLRNRYSKRGPEPDAFEGWEVWTASPGGRAEADECRRLIKDGEQAKHLFITELGPKVKVGLNSVAFAFGDMIKLVIVGGPARLGDGAGDATRESLMKTGSRRRKPGTVARTRALT